jgi:putative Mg2+ transporter-C (MgtC) family protein
MARHSGESRLRLAGTLMQEASCGGLTADAMPTTLTWHDIALRLLLTVLAAGVIGFNRDERGHSAGLRTNLLVALAACIAMIQTNELINSAGKPSDSFVVMDIMRLPLGILSGIGFIGAGAILKRGEMIVGVTTAATLWFVTVMGLCFGGGQIGLGLAAFALGFVILAGLKRIEIEMPRQQSGTLRINVAADGPDQAEIEALLEHAGVSPQSLSLGYDSSPAASKVFRWKLQWKGRGENGSPPPVIRELSKHPDVRGLEFTR